MALPVLSSNTPSAGYISWTAFGIAYGGVSYSVAAGSSNKKYVWWQYNNGTPVLNAADALPALAAQDYLLFLNKNGVGVIVDATQIVDGSLIVSGSVLADAIAANQIDTYHIRANAVTATQIAAGTITADNIAAGAITASKLSIGAVGDNMVLNGSFEDGVQGWFLQENSAGGGTADIVTGVASSGQYALRLLRNNNGSTSWTAVEQETKYRIPVSATASRRWYVSARLGSGSTASAPFRVYWWKADGTASVTPYTEVSVAALGTSWSVVEGQVTPPSDSRFMSIRIYNATNNSTVYIDEVTAHEVTVSAQIADGAITTPKLVANAVTANEIAANAITADKLTANAVTAAKIQAGAVTADKVAARTISADKLLVFDTTSYIENSDFTQPITVGWTITGNANGWSVQQANANGINFFAQRSGQAAASTLVNNYRVPVKAAEQLAFTVQHYLTAGATGSVGVRYYDAAGAVLSSDLQPITVQASWTPVTINSTVPANAYYASFMVTDDGVSGGTLRIAAPVLRKRFGGELLVDGTITGNKLAANAITANSIAAGSIAAIHLGTESVTASKIAANAVVATSIAADAIRANHIRAGEIEVSHLKAGIGGSLDISANSSVNILAGQINDATTAAANTDAALEQMQTYYQFGPSGALITSPTSPFSLLLKSDSIELQNNGNAMSRWTSNEMQVSSFRGDRVVLGNHLIERYGNGTVVRTL